MFYDYNIVPFSLIYEAGKVISPTGNYNYETKKIDGDFSISQNVFGVNILTNRLFEKKNIFAGIGIGYFTGKVTRKKTLFVKEKKFNFKPTIGLNLVFKKINSSKSENFGFTYSVIYCLSKRELDTGWDSWRYYQHNRDENGYSREEFYEIEKKDVSHFYNSISILIGVYKK